MGKFMYLFKKKVYFLIIFVICLLLQASYIHIILEIATLIVSITKFSIVIGSPGAYLSRNRRAIRGCPITAVRFELFQIGQL